MTNSLVTVITAAYNHENYIQETINSIINQTYQNIELIIIDDGSKDSTWQKIQEMEEVCQKRFANVHFETQENSGLCNTLNKLLKLAKGDFVYMIASDDLAKPQAIEKELDFLKNNPSYALAVGNDEIIDNESKICYWDKERNIIYDIKKAKYKTFGDYLSKTKKINLNSNKFGTYETLYTGNYIPNGYLIRKSIFEKIGYFTPQAPLEDWWLMLQISKYAKLKYIDEILFSYRWHNTNTIKNTEKIKAMVEKNKIHEENILKNIDEKEVLPQIVEIKNKGALYKKQGIPFIFECLSYKKADKKIKKFKFLNIEIN